MKKHSLSRKSRLLLILFWGIIYAPFLHAQCTNATAFGTITAPSGGGSETVGCTFAEEYNTLNTVPAATDFTSSSATATDFITVRQGTPGGAVIASGLTPLSWTSTVAGTYYVHINADAACATDASCRDITHTHVPGPMVFNSVTTTQASTANIEDCATHEVVLGIQLDVSGETSPFDVTQLNVETGGSTAPTTDATNVRVYYTGTNATYGTTNLFGTAAVAGTGINIPVTGTQTLSMGTNYFWIVYELAASPTVGNFLDGICTSVVVDGNTENTTVSAPAGNREIVDCIRECPTAGTVLSETFDGPNIEGAIPTAIYGNGGSNFDPTMAMSGTYFGWFNLRNGMSDVDMYDRNVAGIHVGCDISVSYWVRESSGGMTVDISFLDDNGATLTSQTIALTGTYTQYTHTFTPTTPGMRIVIHTDDTGGAGFDLAMEDLIITQCCPSSLPVELMSFDGECKEEGADLYWSTASEIDNDFFNVEQLNAQNEWETIGVVEGMGTSTETNHYSFNIKDRRSEYFRLKQVDFDGAFEYSDVIHVGGENCRSTEDLVVYPNPATESLTIKSIGDEAGELRIYSVTGQLMFSSEFNYALKVDIRNWADGVYLVRLGEHVQSVKIK